MSTPTTIRFSEDELDRIKTAAAIKGVSVSAYIKNKLFEDSNHKLGGIDWVLDEIMQTSTANTKDLNVIKYLLVYMFGKQLSPVDLIKFKGKMPPDFIGALDKNVAGLCNEIIESEA